MTKWRNSANTFSHDLWNYTYDRVNNTLTRQRGSSTAPPTPKDEFYAYDNLDRLIKLNRGALTGSPLTIADTAANYSQKWTALEEQGGWRGYQIAPAGANNYTFQQTRAINSVNEIATANGEPPPVGNSITGTGGASWIAPQYTVSGTMSVAPMIGQEGSGEYILTLDAWDRIAVLGGNQSWPNSEYYHYDAEGRRTARLLLLQGATTYSRTDFYYDNDWRCVEERTASNLSNRTTVATTPSLQWIWDLRYRDAVVLRDVVPIDTTKRLYYCQDANYKTTALVQESTGNVVERYLYQAYGQPTVLDGSWNSQSPTTYRNEILFGGYRFDLDTGIYLARNRYFHPTLGTWLQRDPIGYADGMNLYEYVKSNSLKYVDPWGLQDSVGGTAGPAASGAAAAIAKSQAAQSKAADALNRANGLIDKSWSSCKELLKNLREASKLIDGAKKFTNEARSAANQAKDLLSTSTGANVRNLPEVDDGVANAVQGAKDALSAIDGKLADLPAREILKGRLEIPGECLKMSLNSIRNALKTKDYSEASEQALKEAKKVLEQGSRLLQKGDLQK
jgi:RHS repeat-associated protein